MIINRALLGLALITAAGFSMDTGADSAAACAALTARDADALVGTSLPENFVRDTPPTPQNGQDHTRVCGWFPAGYDLATASAPPARGILMTLHVMQSTADAKAFHAQTSAATRALADADPAGSTVTDLIGVGEDAILEQSTTDGAAIVTIKFVKDDTAAQVQVWHDATTAGNVAAAAAKQIADRL